MKIRTLLTTLFVMFATVASMAQVESGKVYRIKNKLYGNVAAESATNHKVNCENAGGSDAYQQMWIITETATATRYTIQNVYTGRNLHFENGTNVPFYTVNDAEYALFINDNSKHYSGCYTITQAKNNNWAMHCASNNVCVPWNADAEGTNWTFEEVNITAEEIAAARTIYEATSNMVENADAYAALFLPFFEDKACTVLKAEYAAMSDEELVTAMEGIPAEMQQIALKVKNDSWNTEKREKEFRIYDYKPYSDPTKWQNVLYTRTYSRTDNPTGICSTSSRSYVYIFVDQIPEDSYIDLSEIPGTHYFGTDTRLKEGMNIVPSALTDGYLYIRYICNTDTAGKKLADFPRVKIHIENGYVNGFWSKERGHTNDDWAYMQQYMFQNEAAVQAKGDYTLLSFRKKEFLNPGDQWGGVGCPKKISELVGLWDFWNKTQQKYMNLPKYYAWFNNLQLAMSDDSGFMDAGNWRTHYNNNTLSTICNYDLLIADAGSTWGPNHEIGHNNQYAIEIVGTSEVSNNALANIITFEQGTHTSRGQNMSSCISSYENKIPYVLRGEKAYGTQLFSMTRMYFQLFLYAHALGNCPDFYPRLYEKLRYDRLTGWPTYSSDIMDENGFYYNSVNGRDDHLKFAEACCEILQMDLSEFFEAWGFFIPYKNGFVGDYGHHWCYLLEEDAKASKERMQKYEKKGGHLIFLEDRIRFTLRPDGTGYRQTYAKWPGETVGEVGKVGQWQDYADTSVKASGYYFTKTNGKIIIKGDGNEKGALGFKLYNGDTGELLTFTNGVESMNNSKIWASMVIPMAASNANLVVAAAQADGTNYIIPSATEGPEEMQLEALNASIVQAGGVINNISKTGKEVGKYYSEYTTELSDLYKKAKAAYDNKDNSELTYSEWSALLDEEYSKVVTNDRARVTIKEGCVYYMFNAVQTSQYLTWDASGAVIPQASNATNGTYTDDPDKHWTFEYSGTPGEYLMKNESGNYITSLVLDNNVAAVLPSKSAAVRIKFDYTDKGRTYFVDASNTNTAIGWKSSSIKGISPNETAGQWNVRLLTDNSAEIESEQITTLKNKARLILAEVSDTIELAKGDTVLLNKNIKSNDILLQDYVKALYDAYASIDMSKTNEYTYYINDLRKALYDIDGKYSITLPNAVKDDCVFYWYTITSDITGMMWSINDAGRITLVKATEEITDEMKWAIVPNEDKTGYYILNAANESYMRQYRTILGLQQSFTTVGTSANTVATLTYDEESASVIIGTGGKSAAVDTGATTYVTRSTTGTSGWHFSLVGAELNEDLHHELTGIDGVVVDGVVEGADAEGTYDLSGRKVIAPVKNSIYIKGNKKIIAE